MAERYLGIWELQDESVIFNSIFPLQALPKKERME